MKIILKSDLLFTAETDSYIEGFVVIEDRIIKKVGGIGEIDSYLDDDCEVYDLYGKVISPGFVDNHVFFTGYIWQNIGFDASGADTREKLMELIRKEAETAAAQKPVLGHGLDNELEFDNDILNEEFPDRPVVVFNENREWCFMNRAAEERYRFCADECWAEMCWRLFQEILSDRKFAKEQYLAFQDMLAAQGITSIKEIGFDDYYGFAPVLKELEDEGALKHRVNLVSQPVREEADFGYGKRCRELFDGDKVRYMGYNLMIDGDIESGDGDLIEGYKNNPGVHCCMEIDYDGIERTVLEADRQGYRVALHAEGDAAVKKCIDMIEKCRAVNGGRDARHAIVDMEMIAPTDRARLAQLDISSIQYIQIMNCYGSRENYWDLELLNEEQAETIWAYRSLMDAGVRLCFGTDLPLDVADIPLSIKFGTKRLFPDGTPAGGYHISQALSPAEILTCWSRNGQIANFEEDRLGTIEEGKLADITVLDTNIFDCGTQELERANVCMTIFDGKIIFEKK